MCTDAADDGCGIEGGFETIKGAFPEGQSAHVSFDTAKMKNPIHAYMTFKASTAALSKLKTPTALVCKSSRRAGALFAAITGAMDGDAAESVLEKSRDLSLLYTGVDALTTFVKTAVDAANSSKSPIVFRTFFEKETSTYSYLLVDSVTKEAVLIDPCLATVERDARYVREMMGGLSFKYVLNTHVHADHVTGSGKLKEMLEYSHLKIFRVVI
jgi:hypothetical protein